MYEALKAAALLALKLPDTPPALRAAGHARLEVFRAAPSFLRYRYTLLGIGAFASLVVISVLAVIFTNEAPAVARALVPLLLALLFVASALTYVTLRLDYELRYYLVTDKSLRIREGVWSVRELTLSFVNVQNVSIEQGPIERYLGIANICVDTAGGGSNQPQIGAPAHRGVLRGISNAEEVRDLIRTRLGMVHRQAGLGDADEMARSPGFGAAEIHALREVLAAVRELRGRAIPPH